MIFCCISAYLRFKRLFGLFVEILWWGKFVFYGRTRKNWLKMMWSKRSSAIPNSTRSGFIIRLVMSRYPDCVSNLWLNWLYSSEHCWTHMHRWHALTRELNTSMLNNKYNNKILQNTNYIFVTDKGLDLEHKLLNGAHYDMHFNYFFEFQERQGLNSSLVEYRI